MKIPKHIFTPFPRDVSRKNSSVKNLKKKLTNLNIQRKENIYANAIEMGFCLNKNLFENVHFFN